ncbi:hypothetical protein V6L77_21120 [Pannonibacter sp. Pt2-lr]
MQLEIRLADQTVRRLQPKIGCNGTIGEHKPAAGILDEEVISHLIKHGAQPDTFLQELFLQAQAALTRDVSAFLQVFHQNAQFAAQLAAQFPARRAI